MSLGNYRGDDGKPRGSGGGGANDWLGPGWHRVRVTSYRPIQANTGGQGVEFILKDDRDAKKAKATFWVVSGAGSRKCQKHLAHFATACGLNDDELNAYEPETVSCHAVLVGREVQVMVVPDGDTKYHIVNDWEPVGEDTSDPAITPTDSRVDRSRMDEPAPPTGDGIPF